MGDISMTMHLIPPELSEPELAPFSASDPLGTRVLVLAPHPDDETLGCGGSLRILIKGGKEVKVVFLTKGEKAVEDPLNRERYAGLREKEAQKALKILGISEYEFLRFPDRELLSRYNELREQVMAEVVSFKPDIIYSPSPIELNPDHRAAATVASEMMKSLDVSVVYYELVTPIRPNMLVDISKVYRIKKKAIKAYRSQLKITDYLNLISSLNAYRTMTLGRGIRYAEAFWLLQKEVSPERWLTYAEKLNI
jgi:LmbE family N-acetylglucosaminyl deacetylase